MSTSTTLARRLTLLVLALSLLAPAAAFAAPPAHSGVARFIVGYHPGQQQAAAKLERAAGAKHAGTIERLGHRVVTVPTAQASRALQRFRGSAAVRFVEADATVTADLVTPTDPLWSQQWGLSRVAAPTAWATSTGSSSVTIAVLDTGVDPNHPDLRGAVLSGRSFVSDASTSMDDHGHGTAVAGVAAARSDNGVGVAGTCWACRILPVKVLSSTGSGSLSNVANGLVWATDQGAQIVNLSLSGASPSTALRDAVRYATSRGVLVVASAGNAGTTDFRYPAAYEETLSVAASTSNDSRYSWSTHGSWIDVAAPGCTLTSQLGDGFGTSCGTSFSAPMTSGVAAVALSAAPTATATQLSAALEDTSVPVSYVRAGRIDAANTVARAIQVTTPEEAATEPEPEPVTEPAPEPVEETEPEPQPAPVMSTFTGTLNKKHTLRAFAFDAAAGEIDATLTFTKAKSMIIRIKDPAGRVLVERTGTSGLRVTTTAAVDGRHTVEVTGTQGSFTAQLAHLGGADTSTRVNKRR